MKARILALRNKLSSFLPKKKYGTTKYQGHCDAHMNELPVPCYPWDPWYANKQSYYMKHLIAGILSITAALVALYNTDIYWNFFPPTRPGPPSDMVDECDDSED